MSTSPSPNPLDISSIASYQDLENACCRVLELTPEEAFCFIYQSPGLSYLQTYLTKVQQQGLQTVLTTQPVYIPGPSTSFLIPYRPKFEETTQCLRLLKHPVLKEMLFSEVFVSSNLLAPRNKQPSSSDPRPSCEDISYAEIVKDPALLESVKRNFYERNRDVTFVEHVPPNWTVYDVIENSLT